VEIILFVFVGLLGLVTNLLLLFDFINFLLTGQRFFKKKIHVLENLFLMPVIILLYIELGTKNNCCGGSAFFSPQHRGSVYTILGLCLISYFYSSYRKKLGPPVVEVIANCGLLTAVLLNVIFCFQSEDLGAIVMEYVPIFILLVFALVRNHQLVVESMGELGLTGEPGRPAEKPAADSNLFIRLCRDLLYLKPVAKIPLLLVFCLPLLVLVGAILLLFGQQPDSIVRAFTDTYHQGLSQLNNECKGVICDRGHFLCTIAAKGHGSLVRPIRSGVRGGQTIKCNRQLLISNAFEELLEQRTPALHRRIRNLYNRIGNGIHRHYGVFDHKWVSDLIYVLMKPLEWFFLLVLYVFTKDPENRIGWQYLERRDRQAIEQQLLRVSEN